MTLNRRVVKAASSSVLAVVFVLLALPSASAQLIATGQTYAGFDLGITGSSLIGGQNFLWRIDGLPGDLTPNNPIRTYLPFQKLGSGLGFLFGGKFGVAATEKLDIEGKLRFMTNHTARDEAYTNLILDPVHDSVRASGTSSYSLTQSSIDLAILAHYPITNTIYAIAGADYATFLNNSLSLNQEIGPGGHSWYIRTSTHTDAFISSNDRPKSDLLNYLVEVRGSAQIGAGTVSHVGRDVRVDMELLLSIPFTNWMSNLGNSHLSDAATYFEQPAITYPHLWYVSLTFGVSFPVHSYPEDSIPPPASNPSLSVTAGESVDSSGGVFLTGSVTNSRNGKPIDATLTTVDLATNKVVSTGRTDSLGHYSVRVNGPGKYSVTAEADGYLFGTADFEVDAQGRILKHHSDIALGETTSGRTRLLVFFEFGKADLQSSSTPELNRAVELMKAVHSMKVEIAGYSDSVGSREYNLDLSLRRANAVRDFLIQHGIAANRITSKGYGPDSPVATNDTDEGRSENRRVEFVVVGR